MKRSILLMAMLLSAVSLGYGDREKGSLTMDPGEGRVPAASRRAGEPGGARGGAIGSPSGPAAVSWSRISGLAFTRLAIDPQTPTNLYASVESVLYRSLDAGRSWMVAYQAAPYLTFEDGFIAVDPRNPATVYAGCREVYHHHHAFGFNLLKSTNYGKSWQEINRIDLSDEIDPYDWGTSAMAIDSRNPSVLYWGYGGDYDGHYVFGLMKSADGGGTWNHLDREWVTDIIADPLNPEAVYALSLGYGVYSQGLMKSVDGGSSWRMIGDYYGPFAVSPQAPSALYAVDDSDWDGRYELDRSLDGGDSWQTLSTCIVSETWIRGLAIDPREASILYVNTSGKGIIRSLDGGETWSAINANLGSLNVYAMAVDALDSDCLYAATGSGLYVTHSALPRFEVQARIGAGQGTVSPTSQTIVYGDPAAIAVTPGAGYRLIKVVDNGRSMPPANPYLIGRVAEDHVVRFSFTGETHVVRARVVGGHGQASPASQVVAYGKTAAIVATPDSGYILSRIVDNGVSMLPANPYLIDRTVAPHDVRVSFAKSAYTVLAQVDGGHGLASPASQTVAYGATAAVTFTPDPGYRLERIVDNGVSKPLANPYLIAGVEAEHQVRAAFANREPTVRIVQPEAGARLSGRVEVRATASDDSGVSRVEFYIDGIRQNTAARGFSPAGNRTSTRAATGQDYGFSWDTGAVTAGGHRIQAIAFDEAGASATHEIEVTVCNIALQLSGVRRWERTWLARRAYAELNATADNPAQIVVDRYVLLRRDGNGAEVRVETLPANQAPSLAHRFLDRSLPASGSSTYRFEALAANDAVLARSNEVTL